MRIQTITNLVNYAFSYVIKISNLHKIDESHSLKHSMDVYNLANKIYSSEVTNNPHLERQKDIICVSAILHDMCDKKYMNEKEGMDMIKNYMGNYMDINKLDIIENIITTMSYSKVKINGFPQLGEYQLAYHIVREADLLSAYDIDRTIIYSLYVENLDYDKAVERTIKLFESRMLRYRSDDLFVTKFSKLESLKRHIKSIEDIQDLKKTIYRNSITYG